jgi:hypothetical protein
LIVVATFMYGNSQRQAQIKHDQDVKKQQEAKAGTQLAKSSPSVSPASSAAPAGSSNTAPVNSPSANAIQGAGSSATSTATAAPKPTATPAPIAPAAAATTPTTGGSAMPETGPASAGLLGVSAIVVAWVAYVRSKRAILVAARSDH